MKTKKATTKQPSAKQLTARRKFAAAAKARAKSAQGKRKNTTIIRAKKIEHLDVSKVHSLGANPRKRMPRKPNITSAFDLEYIGDADSAEREGVKGWRLARRFFPRQVGHKTTSPTSTTLLDLTTGSVWKKRRKNPNNETARKLQSTLKKGGVTVDDVTVLGTYAHVRVNSKSAAEKAARLLARATFETTIKDPNQTAYGQWTVFARIRKANSKRRNAPEFSSETPIEVSRHYRSGGPGYETRRTRIIKQGQRDLFAPDASIEDLLGYLRKKNPTAIAQVKRKLGAKKFAAASPSALKRELKAVLAAELKKRQGKTAKKARRNPLHGSYGWNTKKTSQGYRWQVTGFTYGVGTETLKQGIESTRAKAVAKAKAAVMPYRRAWAAAQKKANPDATAQAKEQFKEFHGYAPGRSVDVYIPESAPTQGLSTLGEFYKFTFEGGGDVRPAGKVHLLRDLKGRLHLGGTKPGAVMSNEPAGYIGTIKKIEYIAAKPHLGEPNKIIWFHRAGEEGGAQPKLFSDGKGGLLIKGGDYYITPEGIRN